MSDIRHVAFYMPSLAAGGAEKMRIALAREFVRRGLQVDIIVETAQGPLRSLLPQEVRLVDLKASRARHAILRLARHIRETRPDVLIASMGHQNVVAALAGLVALRRVPIFMTFHNFLGREIVKKNYRKLPVLIRLLAPFCKGVICVSQGVAADVIDVTGIDKSLVTVIHNPAAPDSSLLDAAPPIDLPVNRYVASIGRLTEQKNQRLLIDALYEVNREQSVDLVLVGEGPLRQQLEAHAAGLGLQANVHFAGYVDNPLPIVRRAQAFVLSSDYEGFGNVIVEALACGVPVVSTDCPYGPSEILDGGRHGQLVPVGDKFALASGIIEAISKPVDRESLQQRAAFFDCASIADEYLLFLARRVG
jgi:glycosyltransferase involved in cell wall biosynthesis